MKGKWTAPIAFALMLLAFGPALYWRLRVQDVEALIISPSGERRVLALAILTAMIPAMALMVAAVRRTLRLWVVLPLVVLVVLGIGGGGALMTVLTGNFIFPDHHLRTVAAEPEELHLYEGGFLSCRLKVYAAPRGALYARLVASENIDCDHLETVSARWQSDGGVEILDGGVASTPSLFFGPR